eukprot:Nitzschia sp. Nitz4//scaffold69_size99277//13021//14070//NITZ4_004619-RA/size99277-processed-gene-0.15-mRNA-1//1//CDS//3329556673//6266//frame0
MNQTSTQDMATSEHLSTSSRRRKRVISFNRVVHNRRIPHINDLDAEEIKATWIQPEDYLQIRERCMSTVQKMMRGSLTHADLDSGKHCTRGLEGKTKKGNATRRDFKTNSINAVLEEQALQWDEDVDDDEAIMEVYVEYSQPCADAAHVAALQDAKEAMEYQKGETSRSSTESLSSQLPVIKEAVFGKLRDILNLRECKAAMLKEIESTLYDEAAMERRRLVCNTLDSSTHKSCDFQLGDDQEVPSLASSHTADSTENYSSDDDSDSSEHFNSSLHTVFHSRKRRQGPLDGLDGYFDNAESSPTQAGIAVSSFAALSKLLGFKIQDSPVVHRQRKAVVDELRASIHLRQ